MDRIYISQLVIRAQRGDDSALGKLFDEYRSRLRKDIVNKMVDGVDDDWQYMDDVVQETFITVHRKIKDFRCDCEFYTWLYKIARSKAMDVLRKDEPGKYFSLAMDGVDKAESDVPDNTLDPVKLIEVKEETSLRSHTGFLKNAPQPLLALLRRDPPNSDVLSRLLRSERMCRAWLEFSRKGPGDDDYMELWREITEALLAAKQPLTTRIDTQGKLRVVALRASELGKLLEGIAWEVPQALKRIIREAEAQAAAAGSDKQFCERNTKRRLENCFIRLLSRYFCIRFGTSMKGTVAAIAETVLERPIDKSFVSSALRKPTYKRVRSLQQDHVVMHPANDAQSRLTRGRLRSEEPQMA